MEIRDSVNATILIDYALLRVGMHACRAYVVAGRLDLEGLHALRRLVVDAHPGDPRAQIIAFLTRVGKRTQKPDYRGCGMTNAAVEYPEHGHPARVVSESFRGLPRVRQHQRVYDALGGRMGGVLHALQLTTATPD